MERDIAGHGRVDEDTLYRSSEHVVVMTVEEKIQNDAHQFYELPLPASYHRSKRAVRELKVTLAYSSLSEPLDYTATKINFRLVKGTFSDEIQRHFNHQTRNDTDTRNDDATINRNISAQLRDKETVQSSISMDLPPT